MLLNTMGFRLIPNQRRIFSSVLPWVSDICFHRPRAVLIYMSRDMKTKQCQSKYFTFPRKLTHKPLLHTMVCKVQSTHQEEQNPGLTHDLDKSLREFTLELQPPKGIVLEQRLTPIHDTSICSPTFIPRSISQPTGTCYLFFVGFCR